MGAADLKRHGSFTVPGMLKLKLKVKDNFKKKIAIKVKPLKKFRK